MEALAELRVEKVSIPRICVYYSEEDFLPSQQWKDSNVIILLLGGWAMVRYGVGGSAGLCCWQIRHSAIALARSALVMRSPRSRVYG